MLYGSKARRTQGGSAISVSSSGRMPAPGGGEALNRLLRKSVLASTPPTVEFEEALQLAMNRQGKCGLCGMFAWVAQPANETDPVRLLWWRVRQDPQSFQHVPAMGKVPLQHSQDVGSIRTVLFYEAVSQDEARRVPSVAVADEGGLSIHRLQTAPDGSTTLVQHQDWKSMGVGTSSGGALCLQHYGYVVGCNTAGCLFVIKDDGRANPLSTSCHVFEDGSLYQRLWGVTRKWLQGGAASGSQVRAILACRPAQSGARGVGSRAEEQLDVMVLTNDEVHKWRVTSSPRGDITASVLCSMQRTAMGAARLVGMAVEGKCGGSGKWSDACLHVLARDDDDGAHFSLHFLELEDLQPRQPPALLPPIASSNNGESVRLVGATVNMAGGHVINTHVTDGRQLLTFRCPLPGGRAEERGTSWFVGPSKPLCGSEVHTEERRRQSELLLLLLPASAHVIHPVQHDVQTGEDFGLMRVLTNSQSPEQVMIDLKWYLLGWLTTERQDSELGQELMKRMQDQNVPAADLLLEALRVTVVDRTMDAANSGTDKGAYERHVDEKGRQFQTYQAAIASTFRDSLELLEGVARFGDRLRAARGLFSMPSLFPGRSLLSDSMERTVSGWEGPNSLRPWAVAWRVFSERCSRVEDVLQGVVVRLTELTAGQGIDGAEGAVQQALLEAAAICETMFSDCERRESVTGPEQPPHVINMQSLSALTQIAEILMDACVAFKTRSGQNVLLEGALIGLQGMHVRLLQWAPALGVDADLVQSELSQRSEQYLRVWQQDVLGRLEFRIQLAEELEDVSTLVQISLDEIADGDEQKTLNDAWARRFRRLNFATHLLDCLRQRDAGLLWDPPFATYDYTAELASYVENADNHNLTWVMRLRRDGQLSTMVQRLEMNSRPVQDELSSALDAVQNLRAKEQAFAGSAEQMLAMSQRAPHPRGALALLSLAKLSGEVARRRAGTLGAWGGEDEVQAGVVNAQVQLREGGVRVGDPDGLWAIERAARECVEKVSTEGGALPVEERQRLLREGMLLLGHWPQATQQGGLEPSQEWLGLFNSLVEEAAKLAVQDSFAQQLVQEALQGAGPVRMGQQCRWPQHSVQFRYLQQKAQ